MRSWFSFEEKNRDIFKVTFATRGENIALKSKYVFVHFTTKLFYHQKEVNNPQTIVYTSILYNIVFKIEPTDAIYVKFINLLIPAAFSAQNVTHKITLYQDFLH